MLKWGLLHAYSSGVVQTWVGQSVATVKRSKFSRSRLSSIRYHQLRKAGIEGRKYSDYWRLANPLFDDPKHSVVFLRKAMIFVHPDKQPSHKAPAHALQQILNHLVNELRAA
jgi:hypothetical protein